MTFLVKEEPELDRTFKVRIQPEKPLSLGPTVLLKYKQNQCVALVDSITPGSGEILVDRFLMYRLGTPKNSRIDAEGIDLSHAQKVQVNIPSEWIGNSGGENLVKDNLLNKPLSEGFETHFITLDGPKPIVISKVEPSPFAVFNRDTKIEFKSLEKAKEDTIGIRWEHIGGLGPAKEKIRELVEYPMVFQEIMTYFGIEAPKGVLLFGPPGTGKTLIVKALCNELDASFYPIQGPEIISHYYGKSEEKLRKIFEEASKNATLKKPSIILIDEIDSLSPKRDSGKGELESSLVATFLTLMDGLKESKGVIVIGTTNRLNAIDPALRRPGRFEYEVYIGIPDLQGRQEVLEIHTKILKRMPLAEDVGLEELAEKTHGFVGADLAFLCREAGRSAFRRIYLNREELGIGEEMEEKPPLLVTLLQRPIETPLPPEMNTMNFPIEVTRTDFEEALSSVSPSGMREVMVQIPRDVTWDKIGGLKDVKKIIGENIIKGIKNPGVFKDMGIRPARGILLHGPPGTGKTLIAKAISNECEANFISIKGPELRSKWFGESEEKIRFIFDTARRHAPCIVFLDEVDALTPSRGADVSGSTDSIVNQFLAEMDGVQSAEGVFIIGATNRAELIDEALLRPGRFDYKVYIPLPDSEAREEIFKVHLKKEVLGRKIGIKTLVKKAEGLSGAEIAEICRLAALKALREVNFERANSIEMKHLLDSLKEVSHKKEEVREGAKKPKGELRRITLDVKGEEQAVQEKTAISSEEHMEIIPAYYLLLALLVVLGVILYLTYPENLFVWGIPLVVMIISYLIWFIRKYINQRSTGKAIKNS